MTKGRVVVDVEAVSDDSILHVKWNSISEAYPLGPVGLIDRQQQHKIVYHGFVSSYVFLLHPSMHALVGESTYKVESFCWPPSLESSVL